MIKKIFQSAEDLFDRKLKNGTVMVVIISALIIITGILINTVNANLTVNVIQSQKNTIQVEQYIIIGEKKYRIILEEVK